MGLDANAKAETLSQCNVGAEGREICRSLSKCRSHSTSEAVSAMALYSASVDDRETEVCFLELQEMGQLPRKITKPVVLLRSLGSPGQSESVKALSSNGAGLKVIP